MTIDRTIKARNPWMKDFVIVKHPKDALEISQIEAKVSIKDKFNKLDKHKRSFNKID